MAKIWLSGDNDFSAYSPTLVLASYTDYANQSSDDLGTARTQEFTPSVGADMTGAMICLMAVPSSATTITLKLQENTGSWGDTGADQTVTLTCSDLVSYSTNQIWVYFEFATAYTVTAAASTWRLHVQSSAAGPDWQKNSGYLYAIVSDTAQAYSSGDDIFIAPSSTVTLDQSVTTGELVKGYDTTFSNDNAGSYTLTVGTDVMSRPQTFSFGSSGSPITNANRFTLDINGSETPGNWTTSGAGYYNFYGEKPTSIHTTLDGDAASGQKDITTADDMSGDWSAGDTICVLGRDDHETGYETKEIDSISGTTVTFTTNLASKHFDGWGVFNWDKRDDTGIVLDIGTNNHQYDPKQLHLEGVHYKGAADWNVVNTTYPWISETVTIDTFFAGDVNFEFDWYFAGKTTASAMTIQNIYLITTWSKTIYLSYLNTATISNYFHGDSSATGCLDIRNSVNLTCSNMYMCGGDKDNSSRYCFYLANVSTSTFTNSKFLGAYVPLYLSAVTNCTFTSCSFDGGNYCLQLNGTTIGNTFNSCSFSTDKDPISGYDINVTADSYVQIVFTSCTGTPVIDESSMQASADGSYLLFHKFDNTADDHRGWYKNGIIRSSKSGLTYSTVHTAGGLAFGTAPYGGTDNFDYEFDDFIGDQTGKAVTVSVYCYINNAAYYAGTHTDPTLEVEYDGGTTTSTTHSGTAGSWTQLSVTFTPTTDTPTITITLRTKSDAASEANRMVFWDDGAINFEAGQTVQLGLMDLWYKGLPAKTWLATGITEDAVATRVWNKLTADHTTSGSFGKKVGSLKNSSVIIDGEIIG